jgi:hypothetical protein
MVIKYNEIRIKNYYFQRKIPINNKNIDNRFIIKKVLYKNTDILAFIIYKYSIFKCQIQLFKYLTKSKIILCICYFGIYINYLYTYKTNLIIPYKIID